MNWHQKEIILPPLGKGIHIVTDIIIKNVPEIKKFKVGIANIFIKHTSASITINESADPSVRMDLMDHLDQIVPEGLPYYRHTAEGPDDMPAHIKTSLLGTELNIPISNGALNLGTWQGVLLCEHRKEEMQRKIIVTITGK
jgi:secondary thiamine-phosphate synthase enzyme